MLGNTPLLIYTLIPLFTLYTWRQILTYLPRLTLNSDCSQDRPWICNSPACWIAEITGLCLTWQKSHSWYFLYFFFFWSCVGFFSLFMFLLIMCNSVFCYDICLLYPPIITLWCPLPTYDDLCSPRPLLFSCPLSFLCFLISLARVAYRSTSIILFIIEA